MPTRSTLPGSRPAAYAAPVHVIGSRARRLPAPPHVVWGSLVHPRDPVARPWLALLPDEVDPRVLRAEEPAHVVWASLWPSRPGVEVHLDLEALGSETLLTFTILTRDEPPDESATGHLRRRLNELLYRDLRLSYGQ